MDILFHEIEGQRPDFIGQFVPHILPALLAHVLGRDFHEAVPASAAAFHCQYIVPRHQGKVLSLEEKEGLVLPPERGNVGLAVFSFLAGNGDHVQAVHSETEAPGRVEADVNVLVFREGKARRPVFGQLFRMVREAVEIAHSLVPAAGKGEGEGKFRWCNHRVSAPWLFPPVPSGHQ